MQAKHIRSGRRWAYVTLFTMLALSIAGNVAHVVHLDPSPSLLSIIRAVVWPLGLFLGVEMFMRVPWEAKASHRLVRWGGILFTAAIAAFVSYRHLRGLMLADGEEQVVAAFGPLAIDGLMLMATLGLLLTRPQDTEEQEQVDMAPLLARIDALTQQVEARDALPLTPAQKFAMDVQRAGRELRGTGNGKTEPMLALADILPKPVSPAAPAAPVGLAAKLGDPQPLPGWTPAPAKAKRTRAAKWDQDKARTMLLKGRTKADVAEAVNVDPKTIQRLRAKMIAAGELAA